MTRKLYDEDARLLSFSARVLSCEYREQKKAWAIVLDQTAFFPEEGGQLPDRGTLDGQPVLFVSLVQDPATREETILHLVTHPLSPGSLVEGRVDWAHRFDQMQQHSGEHILSGLVHRFYQYNNVGFHLGAAEVTLDFDGVLTKDQLRELEAKANQAIKENLPVRISFPDPQTLKTLDYRSKIEIQGAVRIVEFPGYDVCACCAPHVSRTGEIGLIKVTGVQSHRGGVRVTILCGDRALADYSRKQDSVSAISVYLSAKPDQVSEAVQRLGQENTALKEQICTLQAALMKEKMRALPSPENSPHGVLTVRQLDAIAARNTANQLAARYDGFGAVLIGEDSSYRYVIASQQKDCRALSQLMKEAFSAKGGGSPQMIQGTLETTAKEFLEWIQNQ